jgi:hypothetical protein
MRLPAIANLPGGILFSTTGAQSTIGSRRTIEPMMANDFGRRSRQARLATAPLHEARDPLNVLFDYRLEQR